MERILISETVKKVGEKVKLCGWVNVRRDHGKLVFIDLRDKSGIIQIVGGDQLKDLRPEDVVEIIGEVKKRPQELINPKIHTGEIEIGAEEIKILSEADTPPISVAEHDAKIALAKRLDWRWLDLRRPENFLIFRVWTKLEAAMRQFWLDNGFTQIYSPKFMGSPSESGAELFEVKYFDRKAYLAQSPQFYKQMAMASGFEKVFEIGPVFRANPSFTSRHDTEFTMVDVEISFIDSHEDVMKSLENLIVFSLDAVKKEFGDEIKKEFRKDLVVPTLPFPRLTMAEAKELLGEAGKRSREKDLTSDEEKELGRLIKKKFNHEFVFVIDYPWEVRPFYHMRKEGDKALTKSFDLLYDGLELVTGAQREHRYEMLKKQAKEKGLSLDPIKYYLDFFKFGCPPHGGFGLGPTRMLMKMLNKKNVREVTFLYRGINRLSP